MAIISYCFLYMVYCIILPPLNNTCRLRVHVHATMMNIMHDKEVNEVYILLCYRGNHMTVHVW